TDNQVYLDWFTHIFIPHASVQNKADTWILLILDGHKSHETPELLKAAFDSKVLLFSLPPHTTDQLQPLDVGVFGALQNAYSWQAQAVAAKGMPIDCKTIIEEYLAVRKKSMTKNVILLVFKRMGIHPFNAELFREDDYALSGTWAVSDKGPEGFAYVLSSSESAHMSMSEDEGGSESLDKQASNEPLGSGTEQHGGREEEEEEGRGGGEEEEEEEAEEEGTWGSTRSSWTCKGNPSYSSFLFSFSYSPLLFMFTPSIPISLLSLFSPCCFYLIFPFPSSPPPSYSLLQLALLFAI
ncbi:DDE-domain-containing protein, partial [Ramaria rubella]